MSVHLSTLDAQTCLYMIVFGFLFGLGFALATWCVGKVLR